MYKFVEYKLICHKYIDFHKRLRYNYHVTNVITYFETIQVKKKGIVMKERNIISNAEVRMFDVDGLCAYISMGRTRAVEFAKAAGAEKRIGKRCLYDKRILDEALDSMN